MIQMKKNVKTITIMKTKPNNGKWGCVTKRRICYKYREPQNKGIKAQAYEILLR